MFRDNLDVGWGAERSVPLPERVGGRLEIGAVAAASVGAALHVSVVLPREGAAVPCVVEIPDAQPEFVEELRDLRTAAYPPDTLHPLFVDLAGLDELLYNHGVSAFGPDGQSAYDALAAIVEAEVQATPSEALRRAITAAAITPQIVYLSFPSQPLLAATMMRFQEHYESPEFRGTVFTTAQFAGWYRSTQPHGGFSYYFDWPGFNVPVRCFEPFSRGDFGPLGENERIVLEKLGEFPAARIVIAAVKGGDPETFRHELAHGFFETVPEYRARALEIIGSIDRAPLDAALRAHGYAASTWDDEIQAYCVGDLAEILSSGGADPALIAAQAAIRELFERTAAVHAAEPL